MRIYNRQAIYILILLVHQFQCYSPLLQGPTKIIYVPEGYQLPRLCTSLKDIVLMIQKYVAFFQSYSESTQNSLNVVENILTPAPVYLLYLLFGLVAPTGF